MPQKKQKKIAVILFNLGGPTGPKTIKPFLFNFFMDPNIIPFLKPLRFLLAKLISIKRSKGEAGEAYGEMDGGSPLLENTIAQQHALQKALASSHDIRVYTCMRYWHPMASSVAPQVQAFNPDQIMLVSLYPQFSTTTFWSSLAQWRRVCLNIGLDKPTTTLCCYPQLEGFIKASAENIKKVYQDCKKATGRNPRILFSAHSLPEKIIKDGDPYAWQCEQTVKAILKKLPYKNPDYVICYQSKVGPQKWLGPQTEDEIERAGHEKVPVIVYPHAFVSEHVETIVELGVEYKEVADEAGVPWYGVVETVGTHPAFINDLARLIKKRIGSRKKIVNGTATGKRNCPQPYDKCCQRRYEELLENPPCCGGRCGCKQTI